MFLIPLAAAVTQTASLIIDKVGLTRRRIAYHDFVTATFIYLAVITWLLWPFLGWVRPELWQPANLARLGLQIAVALGWNLLFYRALQHEKANVVESIGNLLPITTIVVAWLVAPASFDPIVAAAATIGTAALAWAFWERRGFSLNPGLLMAVALMAVENVLAAQLLQAHVMSPVSMYAIRCTIIATVLYLMFRPSLRRVKPSNHLFMIASSVVGGGHILLRYYGLRDSGVYITSLVLILAPAFTFIASAKLLHEHIKRRHILGAATLIAAVVYVSLKR